MEIHHIGYLVKKIRKSIEEFKKLGYQSETGVIEDSVRNVYISFLIKDGYRVELVSPIDENSVIFNLMKKYKNSPYHICYMSDNYKDDVTSLSQRGYTLIEEPKIAPALDNKLAVFLVNPTIGMLEVIEK
jgi:methylmalonyl-CoA/ethylmalonyl-CoA epimerase